MNRNEVDAFFATLDAALNERPDKPIPIDLDGKYYFIQRTTELIVASDLVELLEAAGARDRLETTVQAVHHKVEKLPDGSLRIVWDPT